MPRACRVHAACKAHARRMLRTGREARKAREAREARERQEHTIAEERCVIAALLLRCFAELCAIFRKHAGPFSRLGAALRRVCWANEVKQGRKWPKVRPRISAML